MKHLALATTLTLTPMLLAADPLVVFDAGSSGTRIYLYDVDYSTTQPTVKEIKNKKVSPGISDASFKNNPEAFGPYFAELLDALNDTLTEDEKAQTPLYLHATAGMRTLPKQERIEIMQHVRTHLVKEAALEGYAPIDEPRDSIRVITGGEEGMFIWLADNAALGNLSQPVLSDDNTVAALEMGGASVEISYLSEDAKVFNETFKHQGSEYQLYSTGYDGLGLDQGIAHLENYYRENGGDFAACFAKDAPYPLTNPVVVGTGDFAACASFIQKALYVEHPRKHQSLLGRYQPLNTADTYVLTSGFFYTFNTLGLGNRDTNRVELVDAGTTFCAMPWDEQQAAYPNESPTYLVKYCFNAAFMESLMHAWYVEPTDTLFSTTRVNDTDLSWTLGSAIFYATR